MSKPKTLDTPDLPLLANDWEWLHDTNDWFVIGEHPEVVFYNIGPAMGTVKHDFEPIPCDMDDIED